MRKYEVAFLTPENTVQRTTRLAPATALYETAFMALARGTLLSGRDGPIAIEDITPGMVLALSDGRERRVLWKGCTRIVPGARGQSEETGQLTRIPAEAMGHARPSHDLLLGFGARLLQRGQMVPAPTVIDGETAFAVRPPSQVECFHIALEEHGAVRANGLEVETFHPGPAARTFRQPETRQLYLSLFPHVESLDDFGPLHFARAVEDEVFGVSARGYLG
ncbi:MAG: Hint domain-containing protein [Pseudomonadota bacterium]